MSDEREAIMKIGSYVTAREAETVADRLDHQQSLSSALQAMSAKRQTEFRKIASQAGLLKDRGALARVLWAVVGARSRSTSIQPLWTMPSLLAQGGPLTTSLPRLIRDARMAVTCATYNFQDSSQLWDELRAAASRPEISLKVYIDTGATRPKPGYPRPRSATDMANQIRPGELYQTRSINGRLVVSHAKFIAVDHRFLVVTSANFSWSAENRNVEFGLLLDNASVAESVEREMDAAEGVVYDRVLGGDQ